MTPPGPARLLLVGFMGAGKSSVGRRVAGALGWDFIDIDARIEAERGMSVAEIFAALGEEAFRADEARFTAESLGRERVVVAAGGGWAAAEGRIERVPEGTLTVWLRVGAEEALRRVGTHPGTRPLLSGADPLSAARGLLERREPLYARAAAKVDTDGQSVEDVSARILEIVSGFSPEASG